MRLKKRTVRLLVAIAVAAVAWFFNIELNERDGREVGHSKPASSDVVRAIREKRSDQWIETEARVTRLLADDRQGSRHQRFLVDIAGHSVLIAHNIDLAERVPARVNDTVRIRGEFEWNDKGGVIHWTHHDPSGRQPGGWIDLDGRRFR